MYLYLDTTERDSFRVALVDKGVVLKDKTISSVRAHSEKLLKTINRLLSPSPSKGEGRVRVGGAKGIKGIAVVKGPGSFTSLRVGIATANALSFALAVPAVGISPKTLPAQVSRFFNKKSGQQIVLPKYGNGPHITSPKS